MCYRSRVCKTYIFNFNFKVGDSVPSVDLFEGAPDKKVNLADVCKEGKVVVFGVPGAFTPGCSKTHLPGTLFNGTFARF